MFCYRFEMINNIHTSLLSQLNIKAHKDVYKRQATMDNRNLQKRSLQFKKSLDEIQKVLGEGKTKKKK